MAEKRTEADLEQLAQDLVAGRIFTSAQVKDNSLLNMVFMPLALMGKEAMEQFAANEPFVIYEYIDKAGPRGINGYPSFFSFQYLTKGEWETVKTKAIEINDFLNSRKKKED
jgi:hypothetical protein